MGNRCTIACGYVSVFVCVFVCVCVYLCASPQQVKLARFIYSHVMRHIIYMDYVSAGGCDLTRYNMSGENCPDSVRSVRFCFTNREDGPMPSVSFIQDVSP